MSDPIERRAESGALLARFDTLHEDVREMRTAIKGLTDAVAKLALVEERQANTTQALERAFTAVAKVESTVEKVDLRVTAIEIAMPGLKELRGWVIGGILTSLAMMGGVLFKVMLIVGAMK